MSPVASRWEVPRKSVGSGWVRVTSQPAWAVVLPVFVVPRGRRRRWPGRRAGRRSTGPQVPRSATCSSTQIAAALGRRWVWRATRRACQAGTSNRRHAFPQQGEPVAEVEGVGDQLCPGRGGHAQRQRERFGGERRHSGVPSPPSDSSARSAAPPNVSTPVSVSGGVEVGPVGGELELAERGASFGLFGLGGGFEHAGGVEVADLVLLPDRGAHGTKPSIDHRQSEAQNPLCPQGV